VIPAKAYAVTLALADIVGVPLFIAWYIWRGQYVAPSTWVILTVWLVASFLIHGDTPKSLGLRFDNLGTATRNAVPVFAFFVVAVGVVGVVLKQPMHLPPNLRSVARFGAYAAFCFLQQIGLNSLLMNRLMFLTRKRWLASLIAGILFSALHLPNPVLVPLTLIGGAVMAWLFSRERNILPLALGQALVGSLAWWAFPLVWQHMLRVGPGYYYPYH
jgi:membrane protease YdiL (CAAX protease family)